MVERICFFSLAERERLSMMPPISLTMFVIFFIGSLLWIDVDAKVDCGFSLHGLLSCGKGEKKTNRIDNEVIKNEYFCFYFLKRAI